MQNGSNCNSDINLIHRVDALEKNAENSVISIRDYIDTRLNALEKATDLFSENTKIRFENTNEFREQLKDQMITFVTISEYRIQYESLQRNIDDFKNIINKEISSLRESRAESQGKASQTSVLWAYTFSGISCIIGISSLIYAFIK